MRCIIALALLVVAAPAADLAQMDWLVGRGQAAGIDGHAASESWLPPTRDAMAYTFVQADELRFDFTRGG